jgi:hypothetical protein
MLSVPSPRSSLLSRQTPDQVGDLAFVDFDREVAGVCDRAIADHGETPSGGAPGSAAESASLMIA